MSRWLMFLCACVLALVTVAYRPDAGWADEGKGEPLADCNNNGIPDDLEMGPLPGHVLMFDGVDDHVELFSPDAVDALGEGDFTLETWVWTSDMGRSILIGNYDEPPFWNLELHNSDPAGRVRLVFDDGTGGESHYSDVSVADGAWHHVAAVRTMGPGGSVQIYIDGALEYDQSSEIGGFTADNLTTIGCDSRSSSHYLDGALDDMRVWNVARTGAEIAADMHRVLGGDEPGLVAYWRFDEGSGTVAGDSAQDNNGGLRPPWNPPFQYPPEWVSHDPDCNGNRIIDECEYLTRIYVDDDATEGLNDGSSWTDAHMSLVDALDHAECNGVVSQIHVAQGTYKPGTSREATFQLLDGVTIRGGYRGLSGGGDPDDRDVTGFPTILSGDVGLEGDNSDNSYHVVTGSGTDATAVLDGVTITAGYANLYGSWRVGGGMYNYSGDPTLTNCTFSGNMALLNGGGMYNDHSSPTLTNCTFSGNSAVRGGGIGCDASNTTLINCTFRNNVAFRHYENYGRGGGMCLERSWPVLSNCTFIENRAAFGGAICCYDHTLAMTNCTFIENRADGGSAMINYDGNLSLTNCTCKDNRADSEDGAITSLASASLTNCIVWGNTPAGSQITHWGTVFNATYSCIQGGWPGVGNIAAGPFFLDAYGRLGHGSPCIDAGNNDAPGLVGVTVDLDGYLRLTDDPDTDDTGVGDPPIVDMGAYEFRWDCNGDGISDFLETGSLEGSALLFDGADDFVSLIGSATGPLAELGQGDFTLETWLRTTDTDRSILIGNCDGTPYWNLELHSSDPGGLVRLVFNSGTDSEDHRTSISVADGIWHHVAAVRTMGSEGRVQIFIDGVLNYDEPSAISGFTAANETLIGRDPRSGSYYLDGTLDDMRVWDVARTGAEIAGDMYRVLDGDEYGLVAYWRFDEGWGVVASDSAGDHPGRLFPDPYPPMVYPPEWLPQGTDCNDNGILDECDLSDGTSEDCNGNGVLDECDIDRGASTDCNSNGVPDECETGWLEDCNANGVTDFCDLADGTSEDCNENGIPDECDIADGTSEDCNANGASDECEIGGLEDCNDNGAPDLCDIFDGTSPDCNANGLPDECDLADGVSQDCNTNDVPDECETGGVEDCNTNGVPDLCDIFDGTSQDCNENAIPDECETGGSEDCNNNGVPDLCDIFDGSNQDCNENGVPDECERGPLPGHALVFDENPDYVFLPSSMGALAELGQGDFTLETWVWTEADHGALIGNFERYGAGGPFWNLEIGGSASDGAVCLAFGHGDGEIHCSDVSINDGAWHHVAAVRTMGPGGGVQIYVDGVLHHDQPSEQGGFTAHQYTIIGHDPSHHMFAYYLDGSLDDMRVWGVARTGTEIAADMYRVLDSDEPGLVAYWRFDEGAGSVAADSAGDNDGNLNGPPTWLWNRDCNGNGVLDECDIAAGASWDCSGNGIPDECEVGGLEDCNTNGVPDLCDIFSGTSEDCNGNSIPDECEELPTGVIYVDDDATGGLNNGSSWPDAHLSLADAMEHAGCSGVISEIRVAGGTYTPGLLRTDTFQLIDGVAIRGGYRGLSGGGDPDDRDIAGFPTILSGDISGDDEFDRYNNSHHVVTGSSTDATAELDGFTITAGHALGFGWGGGMFSDGGSPTLTDCTFCENHAEQGGGMYCRDGSPSLTNCTFSDNHARAYDGGRGGGMFSDGGSPTLTSCTFSGNRAEQGGGLYNASNSTLTNCTFSGNGADGEGGGMFISGSSPTLTNCVLWGNTAPTGPEINGGATATYSCIQGYSVWPGEGNINTDPSLVRAPDDGGDGWGDDILTPDVDEGANDDYGDLRLLAGSPCIDAGDNMAVPADTFDLDDDGDTTEPIPFDLDGLPRFVDDPTVADTGVVHPDYPELPIIDMGAYEFQSTRLLGDLNCDGEIDALDIEPFVTVLTDPAAYELAYPECDGTLADLDDNDTLDGRDVALFLQLLTGG